MEACIRGLWGDFRLRYFSILDKIIVENFHEEGSVYL